ncbi:MAG TPA: zinc ribbon domain-containing protein, partial [Nitrospirota bacterium]|nr:zinc ribbon domain-containing protein [Nitrospirota bacterium]
MPIYEYHCNSCGADFEKLIFGANPVVACEKCGSQKTEKLLSR